MRVGVGGGGISSPLGSRVSPKSERGARGCVGGGGVGWCGAGLRFWQFQ